MWLWPESQPLVTKVGGFDWVCGDALLSRPRNHALLATVHVAGGHVVCWVHPLRDPHRQGSLPWRALHRADKSDYPAARFSRRSHQKSDQERACFEVCRGTWEARKEGHRKYFAALNWPRSVRPSWQNAWLEPITTNHGLTGLVAPVPWTVARARRRT